MRLPSERNSRARSASSWAAAASRRWASVSNTCGTPLLLSVSLVYAAVPPGAIPTGHGEGQHGIVVVTLAPRRIGIRAIGCGLALERLQLAAERGRRRHGIGDVQAALLQQHGDDRYQIPLRHAVAAAIF